MISIKVYLREHSPNADGIVWVKFYIQREKVNFTTKIHCSSRDWNDEKMRVKSSDQLAADKNTIIENILARINNVIVRYRLKNRTLTRELFWRAYNKPTDFDDFFAFVEEYSKRIKKTLENSTQSTQCAVIDKLREYRPNLSFDEITSDFLEVYFHYLRKDVKNMDSTCHKNMAVIKKYVRAAWREGYMDCNPFDDFKVRKIKGNPLYLTEEELYKIIELYKNGELNLVQYKSAQIFIYMCFSSQHIGDAKKMMLEQFGESSFTYYRKKMETRKPEPIVVPISNALRGIINDIAGNRKIGKLFDNLPAETKINDNLKLIAAKAGINKRISCKAGRHTFATFFLSKTQELTTLKEIMGHSSIDQTSVYAHVLDSNKQRGITCFDVFNG